MAGVSYRLIYLRMMMQSSIFYSCNVQGCKSTFTVTSQRKLRYVSGAEEGRITDAEIENMTKNCYVKNTFRKDHESFINEPMDLINGDLIVMPDKWAIWFENHFYKQVATRNNQTRFKCSRASCNSSLIVNHGTDIVTRYNGNHTCDGDKVMSEMERIKERHERVLGFAKYVINGFNDGLAYSKVLTEFRRRLKVTPRMYELDRQSNGYYKNGRSYNYFILDPRELEGMCNELNILAAEFDKMTLKGDKHRKSASRELAEQFKNFIKSIIYIGRGSDTRAEKHLNDARDESKRGHWKKEQMWEKMREIWTQGWDVIVLRVNEGASFMRTHAWEGCMIDAIGIDNLYNPNRAYIVDNHIVWYHGWSEDDKHSYGSLKLFQSFMKFKNSGATAYERRDRKNIANPIFHI